jgi:hypothetical protein
MAVNKGLRSLVEASPNFSNQALENAVNELKIGWVIKSVELDTAIENNTVLTTSQKNDVKVTINNIPYLNAGRYLNDMIRHTNTILDGSIIPGDPTITGTPEDQGQGTFIEILQSVQALQNTIPELYGVPASAKARSVNDHLGILNNKFITTDDSSRPVFTTLRESISFITNAALATDTAYQTAMDNLKAFINGVVADSTDFQQTLDTFASAVAAAATNFDTALQNHPYSVKRTQMIADRDSIVTQQSLEQSNITTLRTYTETLTDNLAYVGVAEDPTLRQLMSRVAQDASWRDYFDNYETNQANINPIYNINTDSDKSAIIDQVLRDSGLPDVIDYLDLEAVADKSERDDRIDTKNYDRYTTEQRITKSCEQLGLVTANRSIYDQSQRLLNNMNQHDRDKIARALDLNESSNTLS